MKHTKKALALLMVLVMSLSLLTVTAFAAGTGKITIENATAGMEYKLYKVFDASYIDGTADGTKPAGATYTIKSTDPWYSLVSASGSPFTLKEDPTHTGTYIVSIAEGQQETAATWFQNVDASGLAATQTKTPTNNTVTFDGLDKGYYYIKSGVGATVTLTHANETRTSSPAGALIRMTAPSPAANSSRPAPTEQARNTALSAPPTSAASWTTRSTFSAPPTIRAIR